MIAQDLRLPSTLTAVSELRLTNFRSYPVLKLEVDPRSVILTGPNGSGKTNILEAISFLSPGRGLRKAKLADIISLRVPEAKAWSVSTTLECEGLTTTVTTGVEERVGERDRRQVFLDAVPVKSQASLSEVVSVIWLTPQMDRLFLEGPSSRRRFLDRLVFSYDPLHARRVNRYEQSLRERSQLIQNQVSQPAWFQGLEDILVTEGVAIAAARLAMVNTLRYYVEVSSGPFPRAVLEVIGEVEGWLQEKPALEVEDIYREHLKRSRGFSGSDELTTPGPHRGDLLVRHGGKDIAAAQCSTGEQKILLLAIILATARMHADRGKGAPLVLLDEVVAHLDFVHREALFKEIVALKMQAWLTGTDRVMFEGLTGVAQFFDVRELSQQKVNIL